MHFMRSYDSELNASPKGYSVTFILDCPTLLGLYINFMDQMTLQIPDPLKCTTRVWNVELESYHVRRVVPSYEHVVCC